MLEAVPGLNLYNVNDLNPVQSQTRTSDNITKRNEKSGNFNFSVLNSNGINLCMLKPLYCITNIKLVFCWESTEKCSYPIPITE